MAFFRANSGMGGGTPVDFLKEADVFATGRATSNAFVNVAVAQKPKYILAIGSSTSADHLLSIVDVDAGKLTHWFYYNGSFRHNVNLDFNTLEQYSISNNNVGINFYGLFGGRSPYYTICIYY